MGSYGIGISRLVGAIIESSHDKKGIIWPHSVAPFKVHLINLNMSNNETTKKVEAIYNTLKLNKVEVLYDDRETSPGTKFADADLIGIPIQLIVGPKGIKNNLAELKYRKNNQKHDMSLEAALSTLIK